MKYLKTFGSGKFFILQNENEDENGEFKLYCFETSIIDDSDDDFLDSEKFENFMDVMETSDEKWAGVHDGSGGENWFGYSSYEIEDFDTAIKKWFDFFKRNHKLIPDSEIIILTSEDGSYPKFIK